MRKSFFVLFVFCLGVMSAGCNSNSGTDTSTASTSSTSSSALSLSVSSSTVSPSTTVTLTASGGTSPYTYSIYSGGGSISGNSYTASSTLGATGTLKVKDANGSIAYAYVYVEGTITLSVSSSTVSSNGTITLYGSGGTSPYTYSVVSGGGTISSSTYTAPAYGSSVELAVTDSNGETGYTTISVQYSAPIQISPASISLYTKDTLTFTASGGTGTYYYAVTSGGGTLSSATYTAPSTPGTAQVQVWDSSGNTATASITVIQQTKLYAAANFKLYDSALIAYSIPNATTLYPSFAVGGAGASYNFGYGVTTASYTAFAASSSSAAVALTNFNWNDSYPYVGTLVVAGNGGSELFSFCVQVGDQAAHLKKVQTPLTLTSEFRAITFASFATSAVAGTNLQGLWVAKLNTSSSGVGTASIQVQAGLHNHQMSDCSTYADYTLLSASSQ